jgi:nucleoside-diphosphate-sugar epimerase
VRIVVVGASGNAGTALVRRLRQEPDIEIAGVARRLPPPDGIDWHRHDIGTASVDELAATFRGADAVVHLAWQIQPSHDQRALYRTNVLGSRTVIAAAVAAGVGTLVFASSLGVYAPGPKRAYVTEDWPRTGVFESSYSRHKVLVERLLDRAEAEHPGLRVVRLRPGLIFQRSSATEIGRYFAGPLLPARLLRFGRIPVVPSNPRLRVQAVHADDVAAAYLLALRGDAHGAFNVAAGPVLDAAVAARLFRGVEVPVPAVLLQTAASLTWRLRLQPVDAGWVALGLAAPLMSTDRITKELGWQPAHDAESALLELVRGLADRAGDDTPPLSADPSQPGRVGGLVRGRLPGVGDPY